MKSEKYLAGGLIKGIGGRAVKSFMKSDLYKGLKSDAMKRINKLYSKTPAKSVTKDNYLKGLKKLDIKGAKADIIQKALAIKGGPVKDLPRKLQVGLQLGARNVRKYRKRINLLGNTYLKKGERMLKNKKDN